MLTDRTVAFNKWVTPAFFIVWSGFEFSADSNRLESVRKSRHARTRTWLFPVACPQKQAKNLG